MNGRAVARMVRGAWTHIDFLDARVLFARGCIALQLLQLGLGECRVQSRVCVCLGGAVAVVRLLVGTLPAAGCSELLSRSWADTGSVHAPSQLSCAVLLCLECSVYYRRGI